MKKIFILFFLLGFCQIYAQTFTLQELETYTKYYNLGTFSDKIMEKGYEFHSIDNDVFYFKYTETNVKNTYFISLSYDNICIVTYTTTYKTNYTNLLNSITKGYEYVESLTKNKNRVCNHYSNIKFDILTCIYSTGLDYDGHSIPSYEIHISPKYIKVPLNIEDEEEFKNKNYD